MYFIYSVYKLNTFCYILYMIKEHPVLENVLVSDDGKIYVPSNFKKPGHWTYGSKKANGYLRVAINHCQYLVHRLVAETFIPNPENKPEIDHIDRNRANNKVENLRWVTRSENCLNRKHKCKILTTTKEGKKAREKELYHTDEDFRKRKIAACIRCRQRKRQSM